MLRPDWIDSAGISPIHDDLQAYHLSFSIGFSASKTRLR
jgi:hypothetical protein